MKHLIPKETFLETVKERLKEKQPFAFTRFSDGEIMLLNRHEYYDDYISIVTKLWGYKPGENELREIDTWLRVALEFSDIIGYPTERHLKREDYFKDADKIFRNCVQTQYHHTFTSVDVAYELMYEKKLNDLLQDLPILNYISCRNLDNEFKERFNIKNINSFIIAPEPKFTSGYKGEKHYPDQFYKIEQWIKEREVKGELCLVGGGVFSKIYNIWFKNQGGISLDIGAVFDLWAGKKTRGEGRGVDVEDNTYKL